MKHIQNSSLPSPLIIKDSFETIHHGVVVRRIAADILTDKNRQYRIIAQRFSWDIRKLYGDLLETLENEFSNISKREQNHIRVFRTSFMQHQDTFSKWIDDIIESMALHDKLVIFIYEIGIETEKFYEHIQWGSKVVLIPKIQNTIDAMRWVVAKYLETLNIMSHKDLSK